MKLKLLIWMLILCSYVSCSKQESIEGKEEIQENRAATEHIQHNTSGSSGPKKKISPPDIVLLENIQDYSPEIIMEFISNGDADANFVAEYMAYLNTIQEIDVLLKHLQAFLKDNAALTMHLLHLGEESPLSTPEFIPLIVTALNSEDAYRYLGQGVRHRIRSIDDIQQRRELAQQFLDTDLPAQIATQVVGSVAIDIISESPQEASNWLLSLPDEVAAVADGSFIDQAVNEGQPQHAIDYLQLLLDEKGIEQRSVMALERFLGIYLEDHRSEALEWALSLPEGLDEHRDRLVDTAYSALSTVDLVQANELLRKHNYQRKN